MVILPGEEEKLNGVFWMEVIESQLHIGAHYRALQCMLCWKRKTVYNFVWHVYLQPMCLESKMLMIFNEVLLYASLSKHFLDKNNTIPFHLLQIKGWILQPKDEHCIWHPQDSLLMKSATCRDLMLWLSSMPVPYKGLPHWDELYLVQTTRKGAQNFFSSKEKNKEEHQCYNAATNLIKYQFLKAYILKYPCLLACK